MRFACLPGVWDAAVAAATWGRQELVVVARHTPSRERWAGLAEFTTAILLLLQAFDKATFIIGGAKKGGILCAAIVRRR